MSDASLATFTTNTDKNSQKEHVTACSLLWSKGQQAAINRLSYQKKNFFTGSTSSELVPDYSARAARIAATYARFYLEQEEGCKPALKGRFYWMGLAAFASKQVKCGLDFIPNDPVLLLTPTPAQVPMRIGKNYLGKGNFWLFQDIFVWHWFYANYPEQFISCAPERNAQTYSPEVAVMVNDLPWAGETLSILNNLKVPSPDYVIQGFTAITATESASGTSRRNFQFESLLRIADHEQRKILQPLIYNDLAFTLTLDAQQMTEFMPFFPKRLATFSTTCDTDKINLKVVMTEGKLYNETDRMKFIGNIADQYHKLMTQQNAYMEGEIASIAGWNQAL
jgi:hypothetical protein